MIATTPRALLFGAISIALALPTLHAVSAAETDEVDSRGEPSLEGAYNDWSLYGLQEGGNLICYLSSGLERSSDNVARRRPAVVLITNRPAEGRKGVVSVDPGYIYEDGGTVLMTIGRRQFHLFARGGQAWAEDGDDQQITAAIRGGSTLVVTGRMKSGPTTTDTFSLRGFGTALVALDRACPVAGAPAATAAHKTPEEEAMSASSHATTFAPPISADGKMGLIGLDRPQLEAVLRELGLPAFRARQVWHWLYHRGVTSFEAMTTLAKPVREQLAERFSIARPAVTREQASVDGTRKWLIKMNDGQEVEAVHIPETDRGALCVSSQVGCTLTCRFCHTGTQPLVRNLGPDEILSQILTARDALSEWPAVGTNPNNETSTLTNIVMMGMGEPLYNYDNVAAALRIAMDGEGIAISKRRITLSTSGVVPMMRRCGAELGVNLAVSLHAVTDEIRDELMPINKAYPIKELMQACRDYPGATNARRITFEYVMLKGVNDSLADANALVRLLSGIPAKVNLIPFNPWPGSSFECSSRAQIERFAQVLLSAGYASPVREPRGRDILAACGQLRSDSLRQKKTRTTIEEHAA